MTRVDKDGVRREADGSYTPACVTCGYEGVPRAQRTEAASASRQHRTGRNHRAQVRRLALTIATGGRP